MADKKYVGIKVVKASPLNLGDYNKLKGWTIPADEDPTKEGYVVTYPDGYVSWCPEDQFVTANIELSDGRENQAVAKVLLFKAFESLEKDAPGSRQLAVIKTRLFDQLMWATD